ncbi:AfsR/SARP family transcriptional regulator [Glycomyces harbinensis]|uniref:DNA-binding transcriptional activator of the SARP family n=1 Tax=Glycomyces harbinensis TaxID=58114 RepID=A0A1G7ALL4_9ACTN|nr:BTAD domain-containing putative transcriptional regulator [Glycomyces harbinensis]SDE15739.1 DNA-binding transcriptional activator of the SARP family [Glycomyces harbinensis]
MQARAGTLQFRVLGPIEVTLDGQPLLLRAPLQRKLLAALLAGAGQAVPVDALTDALWADLPPDQARKALLVCLHRLRRALLDPQRITLEPAGYRLGVTPDDLDAAAFGELTAAARRERCAGRFEKSTVIYAQAVRLWRGPAYADMSDIDLIAAEADRLNEERLLARQELLQIQLDQGLHASVIGDLEALAREHPFREQLIALRMLALHRSGRQAEALQVYRESRKILSEELGIDPGRLLQRVHEAVLHNDERLASVATESLDGTWVPLAEPRIEAAAVTPRELPADVIGFTGRDSELRELESARLGQEEEGIPASPVVVISGMAGVGKTASAVHWAHRIADDYPDGQLYLSLRGYSALPALQPIEALTAMLRSLGLDSDQVPGETDEAAARLRTETAGKRMLILLDNAETAGQVLPLLPGGPRSLVIVTSRHRLGDLIARHGAFLLDLEPLTPDEATRLLKSLLRIPRSSDRPELGELARSSGYLPLALRIAAANRAGGHLVVPVGDGPHAALKATFDGSYQSLPDDARHLLRLLGIVPVRSLAVEAATVLADLSASATERAVEQLAHAHMVNRDGRGRLYLHDLIRDYANDLVEAEDPARVDALGRLFDWYLDTADAACDIRYPRYARLSTRDRSGAPPSIGDEAQAVQWLDDERENLVAVARYAGENGFGSVAWGLADTLRAHGWMEMSAADFLALGRSALNGALAEASLPGEAVAELCMSTAYIKARDFTDVVRHAERAIERTHLVGWDAGLASAHHDLTLACWNLGRLRTAIEHGEMALAMNRALGRTRAVSVNLGALAVVHGDMGSLRIEARLLAEALELAEGTDDAALQASHLRRLASVSIRQGSVEAAEAYLDRVMKIDMNAGERELSSDTAEYLSQLHTAKGNHDDALVYADMVVGQADLRGDRMSKAIGLTAVAVALNRLERHEGAVAAAAQALRVMNDELTGVRINALIERAIGRIGLDEVDAAEADARSLLGLAREYGYRTSEGTALNLLAEVRLRRGAAGEARELAGQALDRHRTSGHRTGESWSLWVLGSAARHEGDAAAARRHWREVEEIYAAMGAPVPARFKRDA